MALIFGASGAWQPGEVADAIGGGLRDAGFGPVGMLSSPGEHAFGRAGASRSELRSEMAGDPADGLTVLCDARIDARRELLDQLADARLAATATDAELILAAYRRWGEACPEHLIGDYAFVVHDEARGLLFCARDHVGARPFFHCEIDGHFAFASDINGLLAIPGLDTALDEDVVLTYLSSRQFFPFERSFYRSIRKLAPGHAMRVEKGTTKVWRYWQPGPRKPIKLGSPAAYARELRRLIECAVEDRLCDAGKVGLHISGGLDSTTVAGLAAPVLRARGSDKPIGYVWHPVDPEAPVESEPAWSQAVGEAYDLELRACLNEGATVTDLLRRDWTREPDPHNLLNESAVQADAAAEGIDVILSGWGGDQAASFEGRGLHARWLKTGRWRHLWRALPPRGVLRKAKAFLRIVRDTAREHRRDRSDVPEKIDARFVGRELDKRARLLPVNRVSVTDPARVLVDLFEKGPITSRLETWYASGARLGIEYRYPLLDRRILDFCYAIPPELFLYQGQERWLMRAAADDLLPDVVKRHASKSEPVRVEYLASALLEAFATLREEFHAHRDSFDRADFIDMERLAEWLDTPRERASGSAAVRLALQLLDFPTAKSPQDDLEPRRDAA